MLSFEYISHPQVFLKVININYCVYCKCDETKEPKHAKSYEFISSTHSVTLTVYIDHDKFMPPKFYIA